MSLSLALEAFWDVLTGQNVPRVVFKLSKIVEQAGPVSPTIQQKRRAFDRRYLVMSFTLNDNQQVNAKVAFVDKKGNPANVDGAPQWMVDNPNLLSITPAADGMSCLIAAVGPLGSGNVTVKVDADLGAGTTEIIGMAQVDVVGGAANTVTINFDQPTDQPDQPANS